MLGALKLPESLNSEQLKERLRQFLESWPLYRTLEYSGATDIYLFPDEITLDCPKCNLGTFWRIRKPAGSADRSGFDTRTYTCKNCGRMNTTFHYYWAWEKSEVGMFFKVGQWPQIEETVSTSLRDALDETDLQTYKKALRMRNFNFGLGALAYMRRVVENRMNDMLQILYESAKAHNAPKEVLAQHEEVMKNIRFSTKVDYAGELLPPTLRPTGKPNPMAILHELTSDGVHNKTDEECVEIFDGCRKTFEFVFAKVRVETEEANQFVRELGELAQKRGSR